MKQTGALAVLIVLSLGLVSCATALADPAAAARWGDCVAVLPGLPLITSGGKQDDIGGVLASMNVPYRSITSDQLKDDGFLDKLCALFIASGSASGREAAPHLARWVERGGSLYVSGSALDVLLDAFPGRLQLASGGQAPSGFTQIQVDKELEAALGKDVWIQASGEAWPQVEMGKLGARVHARARLPAGDAPVVFSFDAGRGWVVYNVLSVGVDATDGQRQLARFFVIRTLFAPDAARALQQFPVAYASPLLIADTLRPSIEHSYTARAGDDWDAALVWNGGTLSLTLLSPLSTTVALQGANSPLVIPVRSSMGGAWKIAVSDVEASSANAPFLLMAIPRRGTSLLNAVPTPRQVSTDVSVMGSNVGLALAMAVLLLLSASLFADTFAGRQGASNRLLIAAGSAAGKVGGAFSSLFAPTTWPVPPLVRRVGVALELAVFLALTALIASFLDPRFAPTEARGVGIFVGLLVALAVGALTYTLAQSAAARASGVAGAFQIRPGYLLAVAVCVLLSRVIGFMPGFLFGLPAGFAVVGAIEGAKRRDGMRALVALVTPLAVGLLFWLLTIPTDLALRGLSRADNIVSGGLIAVVGAAQAAFLLVFFVALWQTFFEALPIRGLSGWTLFTRNRVAWFVVFAIAAFLVAYTLVNPNATALQWVDNRALLVILLALAIYSAAAVGTWLLFNAGQLRGEGRASKSGALVALGLTILVWLCLCVSGAVLAVLRNLNPR
jgi:hypothetical protein